MNLTTVNFNGIRRGVVHLNTDIWKSTHPTDKDKLIFCLANLIHGSTRQKGRSLVFTLQHELTTETGEIRSFRLKGAFPKFAPDGALIPHQGEGQVKYLHVIEANGLLTCPVNRDWQPEGGAFASTAEHEFQGTAYLGPQITDYAVGYGTYLDLNPKGAPLGFTVFGQEDRLDKRLFEAFMPTGLLNPDNGLDAKQLLSLVYLFGKTFAAFHSTSIHSYPHLGNIGVVSLPSGRKKIVIRDLESWVKLEDLTPAQRFFYLLLDLREVNNRLQAENMWLASFRDLLLPNFLLGYLNRQPDPAIMRESGYWRNIFLLLNMDIDWAEQNNQPANLTKGILPPDRPCKDPLLSHLMQQARYQLAT